MPDFLNKGFLHQVSEHIPLTRDYARYTRVILIDQFQNGRSIVDFSFLLRLFYLALTCARQFLRGQDGYGDFMQLVNGISCPLTWRKGSTKHKFTSLGTGATAHLCYSDLVC